MLGCAPRQGPLTGIIGAYWVARASPSAASAVLIKDIEELKGNLHIDRLAIYQLVHSCRPVVKPLRGMRYKPRCDRSNALRVFAGGLLVVTSQLASA
jgi:uncharacterized membrane protein